MSLLVLLIGWFTWPLIHEYRLHGDDFSPVLYSSAPYFSITDWQTWFTKGYSEYFLNYSGWSALGTDFVRPVVNLGFYLQGMLASIVGDPAYLVGNYLALIGTVLLVDLLVRRHSDATQIVRLSISLAVGLSPVWYPALTEASFATNAFACFFGVAAIVVLDAPNGIPRGLRLWACVALQVLAVWSHETAVVIPFVCIAFLLAFAPRRPALSQLLPFGMPVLTLVVSRLLVAGEGGVYALKANPLASLMKRFAGYVFGPPVPFDLMRPAQILGGGDAGVAPFAYGLAILVNVLVVVGIVLSFPERPPSARFWALLAAFALARLPGALVRMDPRFLGLGLVVSLVVFLALTERGRGRLLRHLVVVLLVASQAALLYTEIYVHRDRSVASLQRAGEYFDTARQEIAAAAPGTVVLVNDNVAYYAARAMLEMAAWPDTDIRLVVVNSFRGEPDPSASTAFSRSEGHLRVEVSYGAEQAAFFAGAAPDFLVPANGFRYTEIRELPGPHAQAFVATGLIEPGSTLVLGVDSRNGSFLRPTVY